MSPIMGIPLLRQYKYLGVEIADDLNMSLDLNVRNTKLAKLRRLGWILQAQQLDGLTKYHLFMSLFRSKINYASNIICIADSKSRTWLKTFYYQAFKNLLNIK